MLLLFVFLCGASALDNAHLHYSNYAILTTIPRTQDQLNVLRQLYLQDTKHQTNFWNAPIATGQRISLGIPKPKIEPVIKLLKSKNLEFITKDIDLQELIDEEKRLNPLQFFEGNQSSSFAIDKYHRYTEIEEYLKQLELEYPELVERSVIGHTAENREIVALKIKSVSENTEEKPVILIDAGIHAREWIAPATALYIINTLITKYDSDELVKHLVDLYDWFIIPVLNPDGYDYTWNVDRMWRKNRSPSTMQNPRCSGVDPNRNFGVGFGGATTSNSSCSAMYCGKAAFSEKESQALKSITEENADRIHIAITLHAYSQVWMTPWGYKNEKPDDYDEMVSAATVAVKALQSVHGTKFKVGTPPELIYPVGGGSTDWQYTIVNTPYVYAVELRPTRGFKDNGFILDNTEILPSGEEMWKAISTLANEVF